MADLKSDLLRRPYWYYIKKHKITVFLGALWLFLTNSMDTMLPWLVGKTIDQIASNAAMTEILKTTTWIALVVIGLSLFRFLWRVFWGSFHHTVAEDLRNQIFSAMCELGPSFYRPRKIGQLIAFITNDTNSFRMGIGPGLLILLDGIFLIVLILPMMVMISWDWTWKTLVLMPLVPFVVAWILNRLHHAFHSRQERFSELSGSAQEIVSGIRVIKSFAQEDNQTKHFNIHSNKFKLSCDKVAKWDSFFGPALELPVALGSIVLLLIGAKEVIDGKVSLGQFFAFYQYIQRMIWPMSAIGIALGHIQESRASFKRLKEVFETTPDTIDSGVIELSELESLEVRDLSFTYPGAKLPALQNLSFSLRKGEKLGIVGMTGAGKSTLIDLLTRQYAVPSGTILINDISIEHIRLNSLRALVSSVPQEAFLFSRKVSENIALGLDHWDLLQVESAARSVRIAQEIDTWKNGYDSLVGERGVNLSGGQKQRMTMARAIIRRSPLVILDDSLSAVDAKTEESILFELNNFFGQTTAIIVSHRLASVRNAGLILVLKGGKLEAKGRHEELIRTSETYQALNEMQMEGHH